MYTQKSIEQVVEELQQNVQPHHKEFLDTLLCASKQDVTKQGFADTIQRGLRQLWSQVELERQAEKTRGLVALPVPNPPSHPLHRWVSYISKAGTGIVVPIGISDSVHSHSAYYRSSRMNYLVIGSPQLALDHVESTFSERRANILDTGSSALYAGSNPFILEMHQEKTIFLLDEEYDVRTASWTVTIASDVDRINATFTVMLQGGGRTCITGEDHKWLPLPMHKLVQHILKTSE